MRKALLSAFAFSLLFTSCGMEYTSLNNYGSQGNSGSQSQYSFPYQESQQENQQENQQIDRTLPFKGLMIPAYFYDQTLWDKTAGLTVDAVVIVNPDNGPGQEYDPNYADFIDQLVKNGKVPVGYVYTKWGNRPLEEVERDVDRWISLYPEIEGFFFDEASIEEKDASYYKTLADYVRSRGKKVVVLNPGTVPAPVYFDFADYVVTYEDSVDNLDGMDYSGFPQKSVCMVYGVEKSNLQDVENRIRGYCQYIYLTDDTSPNPYDSLPSYIDEEEKAIQE